MIEQFIIINGKPRVGKDTFYEICKKYIKTKYITPIDFIKNIAKEYFGYDDNNKTDNTREFLYEFNKLANKYYNYSINMTKYEIENIYRFNNIDLLIIDIREIYNIELIKNFLLESFPNSKVHTLMITNNQVNQEYTNGADNNDMYNYNYDYYLENNSTINDYETNIIKFISNIFNNNG